MAVSQSMRKKEIQSDLMNLGERTRDSKQDELTRESGQKTLDKFPGLFKTELWVAKCLEKSLCNTID